jgi:hypothetical protein
MYWVLLGLSGGQEWQRFVPVSHTNARLQDEECSTDHQPCGRVQALCDPPTTTALPNSSSCTAPLYTATSRNGVGTKGN